MGEENNDGNEWTGLMVRKNTKDILKGLKVHPKEPFNDVLIRLIRDHRKLASMKNHSRV